VLLYTAAELSDYNRVELQHVARWIIECVLYHTHVKLVLLLPLLVQVIF